MYQDPRGPGINYAGLKKEKKKKGLKIILIALGTLIFSATICLFKNYGDACYKLGAEAGIKHGYQLRKTEEELSRQLESDTLRQLSREIHSQPSAL